MRQLCLNFIGTWLLLKFLKSLFTLVLTCRTQFREKKTGKVIWWGVPWPGIIDMRLLFPALLLWCLCLCYLPFLWKTNTQKKGYTLKATSSKCLPGGYNFLCLFSRFPLGQCREALSHLWRPSEWDKNKTGGNDPPHEWPHYSEDKTPEWEWYVHVQPR